MEALGSGRGSARPWDRQATFFERTLRPITAPKTQQGLVKTSKYQLLAPLGDRTHSFHINPMTSDSEVMLGCSQWTFSKRDHGHTTLGHAPAWEATEGDAPSQPISPYLREASAHHRATVDHGAFLPHKEPWGQVKKGSHQSAQNHLWVRPLLRNPFS